MKGKYFWALVSLLIATIVIGVTTLVYIADKSPTKIIVGIVDQIEYKDGFWHDGETIVYLKDGTMIILNGQWTLQISETYKFEFNARGYVYNVEKVIIP